MKITPLDLRNQEFSRTFRGYDPEEVRVFLEVVSDEFEYLIKENNSLTERVRDLDEKIRDYRNMEKALNSTLVSAQQNAENFLENARKEATLILESAKLESARILEKAASDKVRLEESITRLQKAKRAHLIKFKSLLMEQLELLASEEIIHEEADVASGGVEGRAEEMMMPTPDTFRPTFSVEETEDKEQEPGESR